MQRNDAARLCQGTFCGALMLLVLPARAAPFPQPGPLAFELDDAQTCFLTPTEHGACAGIAQRAKDDALANVDRLAVAERGARASTALVHRDGDLLEVSILERPYVAQLPHEHIAEEMLDSTQKQLGNPYVTYHDARLVETENAGSYVQMDMAATYRRPSYWREYRWLGSPYIILTVSSRQSGEIAARFGDELVGTVKNPSYRPWTETNMPEPNDASHWGFVIGGTACAVGILTLVVMRRRNRRAA